MHRSRNRVVFILGAGRSGTTLLYKILSAHRGVAYLSNYQRLFPNLIVLAGLQRLLNQFPEYKRKFWFQENGGAYFNKRRKWLHAIVPTPSEAESVYASCDIPLVPDDDYHLQPQVAACLRDKFERILKMSNSEILLTKRTANNRRVPIFREIFPDAKYIHVVRDGRAVAYSLLHVAWWDEHILYWADRTPRQMVEAGFDPLELAARNWVMEMNSLEQGIALIQSNQLLEVRYDKLVHDPHGQLKRILDFMELSDQIDPDFWEIVESLQLAPKPEAWTNNWTESEIDTVQTLQADTLHRWGFLKGRGFAC